MADTNRAINKSNENSNSNSSNNKSNDSVKVVLITGCSSGLGLDLVQKMSIIPGFSIYASVRSLKQPGYLLSALEEIKPKLKSKVIPCELDVTNVQTITNTISTIISNENKIDVVVNNGAVALAGFSETVTEEEMKKIFDVNVFGVVRLLQAVLPHMRQRQIGHIITVSSVSGMGSPTGLGFYGSSKIALEAILQGEAAMLQQWNIKVTIFQCGTFITKTPHMAEKVLVGSRTEYAKHGSDLYARQIAAKKESYMKFVPIVGIPVDKVSLQLLSIILTPDPLSLDFQIQTEGEAENFADKYYGDSTGNDHVHRESEQTEYFLKLKS